MVARGAVQCSHDEVPAGWGLLLLKQFDIYSSRLVWCKTWLHSRKKRRKSHSSHWDWNISTCPWSSCPWVWSSQRSPSSRRSSSSCYWGIINCKLSHLIVYVHSTNVNCSDIAEMSYMIYITIFNLDVLNTHFTYKDCLKIYKYK